LSYAFGISSSEKADGQRRTSLIVYLILVPILAVTTLIGFCAIFVILMQLHPMNFVLSAFS
jgi:hypothetical protein